MLKLFALLCVLAACRGEDLGKQDIDGIYYLVYAWPTHKDESSNCTRVSYRRTAPADPVSCSCKNGETAVHPVHVEIADHRFDGVSKITDSIEDLVESMGNDCFCFTTDMTHDIIARVDGSYILHYVPVAKTLFLLSKELPRVSRRRELTDRVSKLVNSEGELLCQ